MQKLAVKAKVTDLIHRILIQRLGFNAGAGAAVDRYGRFDPGVPSNLDRGSGIRQPWSCASGRRQRAAAGDAGRGGASAMSGGATAFRSWGAPNAARIAAGRPAAHGEHQGDLQGLRRLRGTTDGGEARWQGSGEDGLVTRCTAARANDT
jgi:hypothetical protein